MGAGRHPSAGDAVDDEEAGDQQPEADHDRGQRVRQRQQQSRQREEAAERQHRPAAELVGHPAGHRRADRAERVDEEDQARGTQAEVERRRLEPEAEGVEDRDQHAHRAAADPVERQQCRIRDGAYGAATDLTEAGWRRDEVRGGRQQDAHRRRAGQGQQAGCCQRPAPAGELADRASEQPSRHPAQRRTADVEAGRAGVGRHVQLLAEVRGRDGR